MNTKPPSCKGCALEKTGNGYSPGCGPPGAPIAFVGEALGHTESQTGQPFTGPAGVYLNRAIRLLGTDRSDHRIGNVVHCQPPKDWLVGAPWEQSAISHCHTHRYLNMYAYSPTVYVTLGVTATRTVLSEVLQTEYKGKLDHWQGYVIGDKPPYVVPTFHPAFLIRGQQHLLGAFCYAIKRAMEVASFGFTRQPVSLVEDPTPEWFAEWASGVTPDSWLAVDIETAIKSADEDESVPVGQIVRINFAVSPDQGVTVPWDERWMTTIRTLLKSPCPKVYWNERFDVPLLRKAGLTLTGATLDAMWAWHMIQSRLPRSLGFVAPFYSDLAPWKHLAQDAPARYAALDAVQTLRCMFGISQDLQKNGQWDTYLRHMVHLDDRVLHPMEEVGLKLDPFRLKEFDTELEALSRTLSDRIQARVPDSLRPLVGGWKTAQPGSFPRTLEKLVPCCTDCGEEDVTLKHKCRKATA